MAKNTKPGQFSPVSLKAATAIAQAWPDKPRMLAAYLILARYATKDDVGGYGHNMVIGAGANIVSRVIGCQWMQAKNYLEALANYGMIQKAPAGLKAGRSKAEWILMHKGDTDFPHAAVDGLDQLSGIEELGPKTTPVKATSAIRRILDSQESDQVRLCALMLLLHCYHNHDLMKWGGVNHKLIYRKWKRDSVAQEGESFRWSATPDENPTTSSSAFVETILTSIGVKKTPDTTQKIFWKAWLVLEKAGLVYEAVMLFDLNKPMLPLRINDFHAGSGNGADIVQWYHNGVYTNPSNPRNQPEGCWFYWPRHPDQGFSLNGVWWLRFRCSNETTARAIDGYLGVCISLADKLREQGTLEDLTPKKKAPKDI